MILVTASLGIVELVEQLRSYDHDTLLDFMKALDEAVADYDFTVALRDHLTVAIALEDAAGY